MTNEEKINAIINYIQLHRDDCNTVSGMNMELSLSIAEQDFTYYETALYNTGFVQRKPLSGRSFYFIISDFGILKLKKGSYLDHLEKKAVEKSQLEYATSLHFAKLEGQIELLKKQLDHYEDNKRAVSKQVVISKISAAISLAVLPVYILLWLYPKAPR